MFHNAFKSKWNFKRGFCNYDLSLWWRKYTGPIISHRLSHLLDNFQCFSSYNICCVCILTRAKTTFVWKNYHDIPSFINTCLFHGCCCEIHTVSYRLITLILFYILQLISWYKYINSVHFFSFSLDLISIMLKGLVNIRKYVNGWVSLLNFHFFMHFSGWT